MNDNSAKNKRIAKNTLLLYVRMLFTMGASLYTVTIVLKTLGVVNYGIYNVVGGVVTLFSFMGSSMASGAQRFIAFALGKNDNKELKDIFNTTVTTYVIIATIAFILLEVVGVYFLNFKMNIPDERMYAANWVFQLSILTFIINLTAIPYNAVIIAHERMEIYAYISIIECFAKLAIAFSITLFTFDTLITYALLVCILSVLMRLSYQAYCFIKFDECKRYQFSWSPEIGKQLLFYSGWNTLGSMAMIGKQQGLNIILNLFFGPLLNAAHAIAQQISGVMAQFINNVYMATRPQITKLYAAGKVDEMWNLVFRSSKLAFYLMMLMSIPILIELEAILTIWLKTVPPHTVNIGRLMILALLIETLANQIIAAYQAANKIRRYQTYASTILLLVLPLSYVALKFAPDTPLIPYVLSAFLSLCYIISIIWNAKTEIGLQAGAYLKKVVGISILVYSIALVATWGCIHILPNSLPRVFVTGIVSTILSVMTIWVIGLDTIEKKQITNIINKKIGK